MALVSNVLREYVKNYELGNSEHSHEELMDLLELYYLNGGLSKYDYEKQVMALNEAEKKRIASIDAGSLCDPLWVREEFTNGNKKDDNGDH